MSTNKKFRIQNGADIVGELSINDVTVIGADGKVVAGAIQDAVADLTAADIADLQSQVTAILGTSPETLDTLQEIVTAFQDADTNLVASVAATAASVEALENSVGAGAALTVTSDPTTINYEEVLGAVYRVSTYAGNKLAMYQSSNFNSIEFIEQYGVSNNTRLRDNWSTRNFYMTGDALFVAMSQSAPSTIAEYNLVPSEVHSDSPVGEYQGMHVDSINNQYVRNIWADDDYVISCSDDGNGWVKLWNRGDFTSQPTTISKPSTSQDYDSWGRSVYRANDYIIVGGYKVATVHNLDGSFVKTLGPYSNLFNGTDASLGGDGNGKLAMSHYGNMLLIGAPSAKITSHGAGAALLFDLNDLNAAPTLLTSTDPQQQQYYGTSVHIDADYIVIGGPQYQNNGNGGERRGLVTVAPTSNPTSSQTLFGVSDGINDHYKHNFGKHVAVREGILIVSADGFEGSDTTGKGGLLLFDVNDLSVAPTVLELPSTGDDYPWITWVSPAANVTQSTSDLIVPSSGVVPAINYLEDKTNDMQTEVDALTVAVASTADSTAVVDAIATSKSEAIAAAAADATTKADAAEADAKAYADGAVADAIDAAPAGLDTLNELAAALNDDANFASTMTTALAGKATTSDLQTLQDSLGISTKLYVQDSAPSTSSSNEVWIDSTDGTVHKSVSPGVTGPNLQGASASHNRYGQLETGSNPGFNITRFGYWGSGFDHLSYNVSKASQLPGFEFATPVLLSDLDTQDNGIFPTWILYEDGSTEKVGSEGNYSRYYTFTNGKKVKGITFGTFSYFSNPPNNNVTLNHVWPQSSEWTQVTLETDLSSYSTTAQMNSAISTAKSEAISTASADATAKADQAETDAKAYADQVVAATVDAAPAALDTLNELAAALGDDANFASTVTTSIATKADDAATTAALATKASQADLTAETSRATSAETINNQAIAILQNQVSGISTSSGSTDIEMQADVDMDSNNIKNANDVYAARGFIDTIETDDLKVQTGTADFEGSIVNFGSATITGSGFSTASNNAVDSHINVSTANAGEFVKWTGTDYEWTDLVSGRLATDQLQVGDGGSISALLPSSTLDWQDGLVHFGGSEVIIDETPTSANHAANKSYVDGVVAATIDAAPAALDTLNELAAALGDDANFSATVTASIGTKASQVDHDAEVAARIAGDSAEASARSSADTTLQANIDALSSTQSGDQSNLQTQITAEVARASSAEAVNAANIVSETSARTSADAALESDIIGLQNQVGTIISGSPASLDTLVEIVSAFETADASLSGVITANGGRLTTAENNITALETDLTSEETARGAADVTLQANIDAEATARSNLGSQLQGYININGAAITAEETARTSADATLQSNIDTESSDRAAAITAEETARITFDASLQDQINALDTQETASKSSLESDINAEIARATSAESDLQSQISNVLSNTDATALNSLAEIVAEFQSADSTLTSAVAGHGTRLTSLESSTSAILAWDTDNVSEGTNNKYWTPERTKTALSGGLCITYNSVTGEIAIDEAETATDLHVATSGDANALGGQSPSHYRIDVYDVNGTVVN